MASFREGVLPACLVLGLMAFLILCQPNLGSTIALLATGFVMLHLPGRAGSTWRSSSSRAWSSRRRPSSATPT